MSEWRGLHNPTWHHLEHSGMVSCDHCGASGCLEASPCRCCLHAEWGQAQALRAEVERLTAALAERDATIQRVRDELQGVTVALAQGCLCHGDVCSGKCGRGTPWAWNLDPERITAALAPKAGGETA